ncbi:hypothetical protein ACFE04_022485 [Oxalis oulophora]
MFEASNPRSSVVCKAIWSQGQPFCGSIASRGFEVSLWLQLGDDHEKDPWVVEEDMILTDAHQKLRKKWIKISKRLLGHPENTVKNHWNAVKRKQIFPEGRVYHCFSVALKAC